MSKVQYQAIIEILDFELHRKDMIILGAILKSQQDSTSYVDFETIRAQLAIDEGRRKGKDSLIYRSLSWLEKTGFIKVDRSEHKHGYNSDVGLMHNVFREAMKEATREIKSEIKDIDSEIEVLSTIDTEDLASDIISIAAGKHKIERPVFAVGWEDVLQLIDDKIYNQVEKGDIVRFSLEWLNRPDMITPTRVERIGNLLENGIIFQGLEHNKISKEQQEAFKGFTLFFREQGYQPGFKIYERSDATYQFVGRGEEGIVLIVS
ncbi:MAG: hypothetical protein ACTSQZ_05115, partial [Candidatus Thorarchaeota archaeon]